MKLNRTITTALATGALIVGALFAGAAPANAAPLGGVKTALAPTCVHVTTGKSGIFPAAWAKNNCSTTQRVKIIFAWGQDSACLTIAPGSTKGWESGIAARFDRLDRC